MLLSSGLVCEVHLEMSHPNSAVLCLWVSLHFALALLMLKLPTSVQHVVDASCAALCAHVYITCALPCVQHSWLGHMHCVLQLQLQRIPYVGTSEPTVAVKPPRPSASMSWLLWRFCIS